MRRTTQSAACRDLRGARRLAGAALLAIVVGAACGRIGFDPPDPASGFDPADARTTRPCAGLFCLDHETGDLSQYEIHEFADELAVVPEAALEASRFGLLVTLGTVGALDPPAVVKHRFPPLAIDELRIHVAIDPTRAALDGFVELVRLQSAAGESLFKIGLTNAGLPSFSLRYSPDPTTFFGWSPALAVSAPYSIDIVLGRATAAGATDGHFAVSINGVDSSPALPLDNFDAFAATDTIAVGVFPTLSPPSSGQVAIDELVATVR